MKKISFYISMCEPALSDSVCTRFSQSASLAPLTRSKNWGVLWQFDSGLMSPCSFEITSVMCRGILSDPHTHTHTELQCDELLTERVLDGSQAKTWCLLAPRHGGGKTSRHFYDSECISILHTFDFKNDSTYFIYYIRFQSFWQPTICQLPKVGGLAWDGLKSCQNRSNTGRNNLAFGD